MKPWVRKLLLTPFYVPIFALIGVGLFMVIVGDIGKRQLRVSLNKENPPCETIKMGHYVVCRSCDFKEFA